MTDDPRVAEARAHLLNAARELIAAARAALDVAETVVDQQRDLLTRRAPPARESHESRESRNAPDAHDDPGDSKVQHIRVMDR